MSSVVTVITVIFSVILTPFLIFFCGIVVLAALGKTLGVRRLYVKLLLRVFEYGRESIEKNQRRRGSENEDEDELDEINYREDKIQKPVTTKRNGITGSKNNGTSKIANGYVNNHSNVISREDFILLPEPESVVSNKTTVNAHSEERVEIVRRKLMEDSKKREFELADVLDYIKTGVEAIIEDQVTSRFEAQELKSWNLLTRTNRNYEYINWKITVIWFIGFWIRYAFLLPLRVLICFFGVVWLAICTAVVGYVPKTEFKKWLNERVSIMCFQVLSSALSSVITYHNEENKPKIGICVANHTSPIDCLVVACDNCYSLIGQRHGGFLGILQRALARASPHIWFERDEVKDREAVAERIRKHVSDPNNPPILIFPEGTCINNTSVMQFKKGSFEVGSVIYPVAIKYDPRFGDAFWNSSKYSMMQYLYMMMTSWAIVCDVWYLPPMKMQPNETAVQFANRVKRAIAERGGLVDLMWDGQLKRMKPKKEWKERQQEEFSKRLKIE